MALTTISMVWVIFAQVLLTFLVLIKMRAARFKAYREGRVQREQVAVSPENWPPDVRKVQNSFANQFELPVLFYVVMLLSLHFGLNDWVIVGLGAAFVATRWLHALIHTGSNYVPSRFKAFFAGVCVLAVLWVYVVLKITLGF